MDLFESHYEVIYRKGISNLVPNALSRSNEATKLTAFALASSADKPKADIYDETDLWYSAKIRQVKKRPKDHKNWRIRDCQLFLLISYFFGIRSVFYFHRFFS